MISMVQCPLKKEQNHSCWRTKCRGGTGCHRDRILHDLILQTSHSYVRPHSERIIQTKQPKGLPKLTDKSDSSRDAYADFKTTAVTYWVVVVGRTRAFVKQEVVLSSGDFLQLFLQVRKGEAEDIHL